MSRQKLTVRVVEERGDLSVRRTLKITNHPDIWFEVSGGILPPPLEVYDFAAIAMIYIGMRSGRDVHIAGPVTRQCLRGLAEFQELWINWRLPGYSRVEITADTIVDGQAGVSEVTDGTGIFAYSGGIDGACAFLRHAGDDLGVRKIKPAGVMLMHGFDIPVSDDAWFAKAEEDARQGLHEFDIPFCIVRTNWRDFHFGHWALEHGAGLFAALHQFSGAVGWGVIGANEDYRNIVIPWGTSALFNHFFSGGCFSIHTECSGMTRCERVEKVCEYPEVAKHIRVCWENKVAGLNCGKCEKCIRTKLNFMAVGYDPVCFDRPPTALEILGVKARERMKITYLHEILDEAKARNLPLKFRAPVFLLMVKSEVFFVLRKIKKALKSRFSRAA